MPASRSSSRSASFCTSRGGLAFLIRSHNSRDLGVLAFALAQLVLDRLQLLPEEMVPLGLGQLAADLLLNLRRKLQDRELPRQVLPEPLQPGSHVDLAQQALLLLDRERQTRGQQVRQPARLAGVDRRDLKLLGDLLALVDHSLEKSVHMMNQGVELDTPLDDLLARFDAADHVGLGLHHLDQPRTILPLADDPSRAVREFQHLEDQAHADDRVQVVDARHVGLGMELTDQTHHPLADHAIIDQPDPAGPVDYQRNHGLRKDDVGSQGEQGNAARLQRRIVVPFGKHDQLSRVSRRPTVDTGALEPPRCLVPSLVSSLDFFVDAWISFLRCLDSNDLKAQPILGPDRGDSQRTFMIVDCRRERKR